MAPNQTLAEYITLGGILCPSVDSAKIRHQVGYNTFRFEYAGNFTNISPLPWMGAYHPADIPIYFGTHSEYNDKSTPFEFAVAGKMQDLFVVFVQDPVNASVNLPKLGWPLNEASKDEVLLFGADAKVTQIENGALNQSLCAQVAAYEGSISGDVDTGQA